MSTLGADVSPTTTPFVHDLVRDCSTAYADRPALVDRGSGATVTYAALAARVRSLAGILRGHDIGPDRPVAVLLERGFEAIVAMLAIFEAGGVYCPLDRGAPHARTAEAIRHLDAGVVVGDHDVGARMPTGVTVVHPSAPLTVAVDDRVGPPGLRPEHLAYVLYTSGSTGRPKGVAMTHRGLTRLIRWQVASGPPALRTLQFTATGFDVAFQEVLSTLSTGGCLVVASEEIRRDPARLLDTLVRDHVQRLFLPYVALQLLAVAAQRAQVMPAALEHVVTAGEQLIITPAIADLFRRIPRCRLDNHYGPTEAHLVTSLTLPPDSAAWPARPSIGAPVAEVDCRVISRHRAAADPGDVGELAVAGHGLARGYLHDPASTAERFVPDPWSVEPGGRLYMTGDLVRAGLDGTYDFLGRSDTQLKVRGFRVEPGEVELALLAHPRVQAAAVGLREVSEGMPLLIAYLQADQTVSHRELSDHMAGLLPAYMVPSRYLVVAGLPRTSSGKVDGRALAALDLPAAPDTNVPGASLRAVITSIWERVLGHDEFEGDDDFFDVGGDSMLATWVVAELGQALGRPVELAVFLEDSTMDGLITTVGAGPVVADQHHRRSQVFTLRPGPSHRSVYLFHPLGGELICYRELARASRAPARILGMGWTGVPPDLGTPLAEIAAVHVAQLRTVQPHGPYLLCGWSFGGVLAYEVAQQLITAGESVEFLGLLDANPVLDPLTGLPISETPFLELLTNVLAAVDSGDGRADLAELTSSGTWIELMGAPVAADVSPAYLRRALVIAQACMCAASEYRPQPYPGRIELFQADDADSGRQAALAAEIARLAPGRCTVTPIPGDHWGLTRSHHVSSAAAELDAALERAGSMESGKDGS